jgi:DNA-directed RNA polymerase subunit RPC12/RpoP
VYYLYWVCLNCETEIGSGRNGGAPRKCPLCGSRQLFDCEKRVPEPEEREEDE